MLGALGVNCYIPYCCIVVFGSVTQHARGSPCGILFNPASTRHVPAHIGASCTCSFIFSLPHPKRKPFLLDKASFGRWLPQRVIIVVLLFFLLLLVRIT